MHILITGGSGFLGQALAQALRQDGHTLTLHSREPLRQAERNQIPAQWVAQFTDITEPVDVVVNLTGANLFTLPWSAQRKKVLWNSRIDTTHALIDWIKGLTTPPKALLSGSAIGFYGDCGEQICTEQQTGGIDWPAQLVQAWEAQALLATDLGVRTVLLRTGPVLGAGGLLPAQKLLFQFGLGGSLGRGEFWFSWIHIADWVGAVKTIMLETTVAGPVNLTAPLPARYHQFAATLGSVLHRPVWLSPPLWALRPVLGQRTQLLTSSTRAEPEKLNDLGYPWQFPDITSALSDLCQRN